MADKQMPAESAILRSGNECVAQRFRRQPRWIRDHRRGAIDTLADGGNPGQASHGTLFEERHRPDQFEE